MRHKFFIEFPILLCFYIYKICYSFLQSKQLNVRFLVVILNVYFLKNKENVKFKNKIKNTCRDIKRGFSQNDTVF